MAEAAIASFVTPDAAERQEAAITRRLDQQNRTAERLERNLGIAIEMLALYVRHWLTTTPPLPEAAQAAAQARGRSRYDGFVAALKSEHNVGAGVYYPIPNHRLPSLTHFAPGLDLPETERAAREVVSLPVHPSLSRDDLERIVAAVNTVAGAGA